MRVLHRCVLFDTKIWKTVAFIFLALVLSAAGRPQDPANPESYPPDPSGDISWTAGYIGVADIQSHFNLARSAENPALPPLVMPSQAEWNTKSNGEKALFLVNSERAVRGVPLLQGVESNVTTVAQNYANYLLANNLFTHCVSGSCPKDRLHAIPAIGACHDFIPYSENLAALMTSASSLPLPLERAVYAWLYADGSCCSWGHRHALLHYPYADNSGTAGKEGFMGIGTASGAYRGWPLGTVVVYNTFDPCSTWGAPPQVSSDAKLVLSLLTRIIP